MSVRKQMLTDNLKNIELPPMPQVAARVMQIDESQISVSAEQIRNIIQADPALSTKILKLANSAFYARGNRITNLSQAIALLGFKTVKGLSLLVSAASIMPKKGNFKIMKELWMRSVLTALISKIIAERVGKDKQKDEIFMTGLLRQIGKSIMANQYADEYSICFQMSADGADEEKLHQLENMKWQFTSADVSAHAMKVWNFPPELTASAGVLRYRIGDAAALEKEQPMLLPVLLAEYIVLLSGYTETLKLDAKLRDKLLVEFGKITPVYNIDETKKKYYLEDLRQVITKDSFYSFCGELFTN
ncbi:MAG: HDOD domain-containing protein [Leptospiraceae bacterium]|nr:HDOD domain-containing protein [Leptospiraceae bacterium]